MDFVVLDFVAAITSLVNFTFPFLLVLNKWLNLLDFVRFLEKPHFIAYSPPDYCPGGFPRCLYSLGCFISLAL